MIFVTLGSQKFQFNRLLQKIDELIENGKLNEEVFAQIGYSDYQPKNYMYKQFLDRDEFESIMQKCEIVITHGGTGAIVGAIKKEKRVIAVARLEAYKEHVDDHQIQIVSQFNDMGFIYGTKNIDELEKAIKNIRLSKIKNYISNTEEIIRDIEEFLK